MELKHWAAYLPYGLKLQVIDTGTVFELKDFFIKNKEIRIAYGKSLPILRHISDLTKEIEHNGEKFVPLENLKSDFDYRYDSIEPNLRFDAKTISFIYDYESDFSYDGGYTFQNVEGATCRETYFMIQKLLEWHFDVFGLIEKGEAIAKE